MKKSAGILTYRINAGRCEVLLVHPGGPFYARKDAGVWSIPKGEYGAHENALDVACREFTEETGHAAPAGPFHFLGTVRLKSGKELQAWAAEGNYEPPYLGSNLFEMEWPPRSGRTAFFPEADRAAWFNLPTAAKKIHPAQAGWLEALKTG